MTTTTTTMYRSNKSMMMQMFLLPMVMALLLASSFIIPYRENLVGSVVIARRSIFETSTDTTNVGELTTVKGEVESGISYTTTNFGDHTISPIDEVKTITNNDPLNTNVTQTVVSPAPIHSENKPEVKVQQSESAEESNDILTDEHSNVPNTKQSETSSDFELSSSVLTEDLEKSIRTDVKNAIEMDQKQTASSSLLEHIAEPDLHIDLRSLSQVQEDTQNVQTEEKSNTNEERESQGVNENSEDFTGKTENIEVKSETSTVTSYDNPTEAKSNLQDEEELTTGTNILDDNLSIVLSEDLAATTTIVPIVDNIESGINLHDLITLNNIEATTITASSSVHSVKKKEGVEIDEEFEIESTTASVEYTTPIVVIVEANDVDVETSKIVEENKQSNIENIITVRDSSEEDSSSDDNSVEDKINQEEIIIAQETATKKVDNNDSVESNENSNEDSVENDKSSQQVSPSIEVSKSSGLEEIAGALPENENNAGSTKGSRSISSMHDYSHPLAPPNNALNDKLNAESNSGQAQLTNSKSNSKSAIIMAFTSGFIGLLLLIALVTILITIKRQHGTLDIELQEQRCGKDEFDEETSETRVKLLDIELPAPSVKTALTASQDNEDCL